MTRAKFTLVITVWTKLRGTWPHMYVKVRCAMRMKGDLGISSEWVVSFTPSPLYPQEGAWEGSMGLSRSGCCGGKKYLLPMPGIESRVSAPVACRYTDWHFFCYRPWRVILNLFSGLIIKRGPNGLLGTTGRRSCPRKNDASIVINRKASEGNKLVYFNSLHK